MSQIFRQPFPGMNSRLPSDLQPWVETVSAATITDRAKSAKNFRMAATYSGNP